MRTSPMLVQCSPLGPFRWIHILFNISPSDSIAWMALVMMFMKTWFNRPGWHITGGISSPNPIATPPRPKLLRKTMRVDSINSLS